MRIELGAPMKTAPRDTLLLASDGITDNLLIDAIIEQVRKGPVDAAISQLMDSCEQKMNEPDGHIDDHTAILFRRTRKA